MSIKSDASVKISKEPFFVVLATLVFVFLFLGAGPGQTLSPTYIFQDRAGWQEFDFVSAPGASKERSDILDVELPLWIEAKEAITKEEGTILENRNGGRKITNFTFGLLSPSFIVFLLVPDNGVAWYLSLFVQMSLMMTGYYALGRLFAPTSILLFALAGAATFSGYVSGWFYAAPAEVLAIAPWFIFSTLALLRKITPASLFGLFITSFFTISAGSPHVASLFLYMSAFIVVTNIFAADDKLAGLKKFAYWALTISLSFLTQIRWLYVFIQEIRAAPLADRVDMGSAFRTWPDLLGTLYPFFMGNPTAERSTFLGVLVLGTIAGILLTVRSIRNADKPFGPTAKLALSFTIIFILSVGYSFNWPLLNMIRLLPTLDNSLASRGFAAVILSSFVLSSIALGLAPWGKKIKKHHIKAIFLTLTILSLGVSKLVFDYFNPSSPLSQFHPEPSAVEYVSKNSGRFDYTLADNTFMTNGTLSGFGIKEWFSHSQINRDPAVVETYYQISSLGKQSPTNVAPTFESINFSSGSFDELSISYVITARENGGLAYATKGGGRKQIPREIFEGRSVDSVISFDSRASISEVRLLLATYGQSEVRTEEPLVLSVKITDGDNTVDCESNTRIIKDNSWLTIGCAAESVKSVGPGDVQFSITARGMPPGLRLASWSFEDPSNQTASPGSKPAESVIRVFKSMPDFSQNGWSEEKLPHATIYRNLESPRGPYLMRDSQILVGSDTLIWQEKEDGSIEITSLKSGKVVIPIGKHGYYMITHNGEEILPALHRDMMPAVTVESGDEIRVYFEEKNLGLMGIIELASVFFLALTLIFSVPSRRLQGRRK